MSLLPEIRRRNGPVQEPGGKRVVVYFAQSNSRSVLVGDAMFKGIQRCGQAAELISSLRYRRPQHDVALFYGFADGLAQIFREYQAAGRKVIYIDLGYWGRKNKSKFDGYHKLIRDARHPTGYFQNKPHGPERFRSFGVGIEPWRPDGRNVVVVGMSGKGAVAEGFAPQQWERQTIDRLRDLTKRPIVYRPKPTWIGARPIPGSIWMKDGEISDVLREAYCVVTHHSNVAVDAVLAGVPCICPHGVASVMSAHRLEDIENLIRPPGREQWAYDIAHTQYSMAEMMAGDAWSYLVREGLV